MAGEPLPDDLELLRRLMAEASAFLDYYEPIVGRMNATKDYNRQLLDQDRITIRRSPVMCNLLKRHFAEETISVLADIRLRAIAQKIAMENGIDPAKFDQEHILIPGRDNPLSVLTSEVRRLQTEIAAKIEGAAAAVVSEEERLANALSNAGHPIPAALVRHMIGRDPARVPFDEIKDKVQGDGTNTDSSVKTLASRTTKLVRSMGGRFEYRTASGNLIKQVPPM